MPHAHQRTLPPVAFERRYRRIFDTRRAETKKPLKFTRKIRGLRDSIVVGARGFEPPTPSSRTRCATRLRYAPTGLACANEGGIITAVFLL